MLVTGARDMVEYGQFFLSSPMIRSQALSLIHIWIPVVAASAAQGEGMKELMEAVGRACDEPASPDIAPVGYGPVLELSLIHI